MAGKGSGAVLGYLKYVLSFDSLAFEQGIGDADKRLKAAQKSMAKTAANLQNAGAKLSIGLTAPILGIAAASVQGAQAQAAAMAQVDSALNSMGQQAGRTREQLLAASDALEMKSLFDGDVILKQVTANLLTFGNVAGEQFDRAQQAAVDMATRLGGEPQAAAIMLGKALNDPIKGITALTRVGVSFSAAQQQQIKDMAAAGDVAGAQALILAELEKQYGGAAAAAANTDPWRQAQVAMGQAGDKIGEALLPLIPPLADAVVRVLSAFTSLSPEMQTFVLGAGAVGAALGPLAIGIGSVVSASTALLPLVTNLGPAWVAVQGAMAAARVAALAALPALLPFAAPLAAIAGAAALVYAAYQHWDKIKPIIDRTLGWVRGLYEGVKTWLVDKLGGLVRGVTNTVSAMVKPFRDAYIAVVGNSYIPDMVTEVGQHMNRLKSLMVNPAVAANDNVASSFERMAQSVTGSLSGLANSIKSGDIGGILGGVLDTLGALGVFKGPSLKGLLAKGNGITSANAVSLPGFARGGGMKLGGLSGRDSNVLSLNGRGIAKVSRGENMFIQPEGEGRGSSRQPSVVQLVVGEGQIFEPRVQAISGGVSVQTVTAQNAAMARMQRRRMGR